LFASTLRTSNDCQANGSPDGPQRLAKLRPPEFAANDLGRTAMAADQVGRHAGVARCDENICTQLGECGLEAK